MAEKNYDLAYISGYLWWLNISEADYRASQNIALAREAFRNIRDQAGDACVGLVYQPTKGHIYFQYADPAGNRDLVLENGVQMGLNAEGWIVEQVFGPLDYASFIQNVDNQHTVMREVAQELGLHFIDLVPAFQAAAQQGRLLYYPYDSHMSEAGHILAGETIAAYLEANADGCD
ncbi:MAG: hypothetical protein HC915_01725 [Anaerolineae bacterium]|nr:hypothetical protein [Anaerolineae bacterium]